MRRDAAFHCLRDFMFELDKHAFIFTYWVGGGLVCLIYCLTLTELLV